MKISELSDKVLARVGCPLPATVGDSFLPSVIGKVTYFNAHGGEELDRSGGKETLDRMVNRTWNDWHGQPHSGVSSVSYQRWPRITISPPEDHFRIIQISGEMYIASELRKYCVGDDAKNLHTLNLFLECFGQCEVFDGNSKSLSAPRLKKRNWELLPQGSYPWAKAKMHIQKITQTLSKDAQAVIDYRMKQISSRNPDILAMGRGGFHGYFVFGFSSKNLFVLESIHLDNATYLLGTDWEAFSELTKREILEDKKERARIIHNKSWWRNLNKYLR
ncbi:MAG: hypothetical protein ACSHX7_14155 [Luteolibacter sp.]